MATKDISRSAFDPRKQYSGVRMQQGRVMLDEDYNESERIENEDRRRSRLEIIGPAGSPNDGFRIATPRLDASGRVDFDIRPGAFYLGGLRLEMFSAQTFRAQSDFVDMPPTLGPAPSGERFDLVYLLAYEEPVNAMEDSELFEAALSGPDTSARMRIHQRVLLAQDIGAAECDQAWHNLRQRWVAAGLGLVNEENELVADESLLVSFVPGGDPSDLCTPLAAGGYLGAENQAVRVQLTDPDHFTWGFDNAAPLYRVQAAADRQTLTLLTDPRDQAHWPLAGQVAEVLPWAAVLPNGEKLAANRGHLSRVEASYNPDTRQLKLVTPVPTAGFDDWTGRPDAADLGASGVYYFLRVWNRGSDRASDPSIAFAPGAAVTLGQTGLQVMLNGMSRVAEDYWIIAARPETPDRVVPWDFETGRGPHGVRRFVTPLAMIHWTLTGGEQVTAEVGDCRDVFPPLTRLQTCCSYTVGDGVTSRGNFNSIEEALQHLPAAGGEICLLPGFHQANVVIEGRRNIKISGCEKRSQVTPRPENRQAPVFLIRDSRSIILENMDLVTLEGSAVVVEGSRPGGAQEIEMRGNRMLAYRNAIHVVQGAGINIHHNLIRMLDREGGDVAIFILAEDGRIERNDIGVLPFRETPPGGDQPPGGETPPDPTDPCADFGKIYRNRAYLLAYTALAWSPVRAIGVDGIIRPQPFRTLGGIQVGSGSERIDIVENRISGGAGNGITLGSDLEAGDLPGGEPPEEGEVIFNNPRDVIAGVVGFENKPFAGAILTFQARDGTQVSTVSDERGFFRVLAAPGQYTVLVSNPGYRAARISLPSESITNAVAVFQPLVRLDLERAPAGPDLQDALAFIYEVTIDGNEISEMGLCGIGAPHLDLQKLNELLRSGAVGLSKRASFGLLAILVRFFGVLTGIVSGLLIQENRIFDCMHNPFDDTLRAEALLRGLGGISLGLCDEPVIRENRIEKNGIDHVAPLCGIFIAYAEQLEIYHNQVQDNGPLDLTNENQLLPGLRSGIFIKLASARSLADELTGRATASRRAVAYLRGVEAAALQSAPPAARFAARIHANLVEQPVGRALSLLAFGPVAVTDNRFNTDYAGQEQLDVLAGSVGILNLGRAPYLGQAGGLASGFTGTTFTTGAFTTRSIGMFAGLRSANLPDGNTQFNDNQTLLGRAGRSIFSQTILTLDDLDFNSNQSDVLNGPALRINTLLLAPTVRAANNRLKEPIGGR